MPVLDNDKHYWVGDDEVEKLLRRGDGWLATHPARELIAARYLRNQRPLARDALARLADAGPSGPDATTEVDVPVAEVAERAPNLHEQRLHADHRFEWTREQFHGWAEAVAARHGYAVRISPLGPEDPAAGAPSQMAVFTRHDGDAAPAITGSTR